MARKIINVGQNPGGQGDGDSLREAFIKAQENFDELYTVFPVTDTSLEHDDPTVDGTIARALADSAAAGGGTVQLGPGIFACPNATLIIPPNVTLRGAGRRASIIEVTHSGDGISIPDRYVTVESLMLMMPKFIAAGDGIKATIGMLVLRDIYIAGGSYDTWGINLDGVNVARLDNIQLGILGQSGYKPDSLTGNGILFQNTRSATQPVNYGDSKLTNIHIHLYAGSRTGIKLHGPDDTDLVINNILLSKVNIHTGVSAKSGTIGVHLRNARRNTLLCVDLEGLETAILEEHGGEGPNVPWSNSYISSFALASGQSYVSNGVVQDRTFIGCDGIEPLPATDAETLLPRSIWINNGDLRIGKKGDGFQLDDGDVTSGMQFLVKNGAATVRTTRNDADAKLSLGRDGSLGVECLPGLVLPPQSNPVQQPSEGMIVYYRVGIVGQNAGLYQFRQGVWVFIA